MRAVPTLLLLLGCFLGPVRPIQNELNSCVRLPQRPKGQGEMAIKVVEGTDAKCNDGSPPAMHIRAATDPSHRNDWVIFVEGGNSCHDQRECQNRWCGVGEYNATKMSSKYYPERIHQEGVLDTDPDKNPFSGYNAVQFRYCSSDMWLGNASQPVELSGLINSFSLYYQGDRVMRAMLDELDRGTRSDDGSVSLPPLTEARSILFTGSSAGGIGMLQHLDYVHDRYRQARVAGAMDAYNSLNPDEAGPQERAKILEAHQYLWDDLYQLWQANPDKDCGKGVNCTNVYYLLRDAVTTPLLIRFDQLDPVVSRLYLNFGMSMDRFSLLSEAAGRAEAKLRQDISVIEQTCREHQMLPSSKFTSITVQDAKEGGRYWNMADAMVAFLDGQKVVALDDPKSKAHSKCGGGSREEPTDPRGGREQDTRRREGGGKAGGREGKAGHR